MSATPKDAVSSIDKKNVALRMSRVFAGNTSWHYRADFKNITFEGDKGEKRVPRYEDVEGAPTLQEFEDHLNGVKGLLVIPITKAGACRFGKIDVDVYGDGAIQRAIELKRKIARLGFPLIVELSKSGGVHLAHYSQHPLTAVDMREKLADWKAALSLKPSTEIFPKQDKLSAGEPGSGINLPYFGAFGHGIPTNHAIGDKGQPLTVEEWLKKAEELPADTTNVAGEVNVEAASELLSKHWTDGQRDNLNIAVAGTLLRAGLEASVIQEIINGASDLMAGDLTSKQVEKIEADLAAGKRVPGYWVFEGLVGRDDAQEFMRLVGGKPPPDIVPFDVRSVAEEWLTVEAPPVVYAVKPLFPSSTVTVNVAEGGVGKTGFGLTAAICVATNRPFFDHEVTQGIAVYIALEENPNSMHRRVRQAVLAELKRMQQEKLSPERIERFNADLRANFFPIAGAGVEMQMIKVAHGNVTVNTEAADRLVEKLPPNPMLIIADPIARMHGSDENANNISTGLINAGERVAQKTGAAFVYMHHVSKASASTRDKTMNAARGGSGLIAGARSSIRMLQVDSKDAEQFANVPFGVIEAGDLIEVVHNKLNDGKKNGTFYLRRQEFAFERFEPILKDGATNSVQLLGALFNWFVNRGRKPFQLKDVRNAEDRAAIFAPLRVRNRDEAEQLIKDAIDDGDIIKSSEKAAPNSKEFKLVFRGDFDVPM